MTEERFRELYDLLAGDRRQRLAWWTLQCGEHQNIALELLEEVERLRSVAGPDDETTGAQQVNSTNELPDVPETDFGDKCCPVSEVRPTRTPESHAGGTKGESTEEVE